MMYWVKLKLRVLYRWIFNPYDDFFIQIEDDKTKILINDLRGNISKLAKQNENKKSAHDEWKNCLLRLEYLVKNNNPIRFLRWDVTHDTMFVGSKPYVKKILKELQSSSDFSGYWENSIQDNGIGSPPKLPYLKTSTGSAIVNSYHLHILEQNTNIKINYYDFILEFGGGYGCLCNIIYKLGFKGKYIIYDFAHYNYLQKFFLSSNNQYCSQSIDQLLGDESDIYFSNNIETLEQNIASLKQDSKKLFIANWSLSEAPIFVRTPFEPLLKNFDTILIAFQGTFSNIDNNDYFKKFIERHITHTFKIIKIEHIPDNYYLVGVKTNPN